MHLELQLFAFVAGAVCYVGYFNRGEHHLHGVAYLQVHTVAFLGLTALLYRLGFRLVEAILQTCVYDGLFLAGLFTSLLVYRAFLNPLNVFPGPWTARITSFDMTFRIRKGQMYKTLLELHRQHGNFVRIGTSELSITHRHAVQEIFGADSVCQKSPWYDISRPQDSLLLRRTYEGHAELRSIWSHAFSIKAMRGYEDRTHTYRNKLIAGLDAHAGQAVDVNHWLALYSWDVLSDLSFGHPFGMLDTKEKHWAIRILKNGMSIVGLHLPMWWLRLVGSIPGSQEGLKTMFKYCQEEMLSRWKVCAHSVLILLTLYLTSVKQTEPKRPDVMSHLFAPYRSNKKTWDDAAVNLLAGEAHLLINAGR
jgi:tryprostatin B 6-hydroxylase